MRRKFNIAAVILIFTGALILSGCEKFLDVTPQDKTYEKELLQHRSGFESTLAGVYVTLNSTSLYGKELKYGLLETLVGTYNAPNSAHYYYNAYRHEYNFNTPKTLISSIWRNLYQTINTCNILLDNVDNIKNDPYYDLVKAEALGLRAFAHFQLLKLFGPVIKEEGVSAAAIPYRDQVSYTVTKFHTAEEVKQKLMRDLNEAKALFAADPIRSNARTADLNIFAYEQYNSLIDRRGVRMNYYAVCALQSLLHQWYGEPDQAAQGAEELIVELNQSLSMRLILPSELSTAINRRTPIENIFALISQNLLTNVLGTHPRIEDTRTASTSPLLFPNYNWLNTSLYTSSAHGSSNDFRLLNWFGRISTTSTLWKIVKYHFDDNFTMTNTAQTTYFENKIISLHTIYMVAAEHYAETNPVKAIEYLNKVRNARDITSNLVYNASMTPEVIRTLVFDEMRKENIGEGYMFTEYKRLFKPIHRATNVAPAVEKFRLPVPEDELLYNPQI